MKPNKILRGEIFQIINNQLKTNSPPETKITYERLIDQGYSDIETKQLIGQCIAVEFFNILKFQQPFDENR